ncbi:brefeldin A-inhibited guanine nucleotide-exchange protein 1 [Tanacetum coccineum]
MDHSNTLVTRKNTTDSERQAIYQSLLEESFNGQLKKGTIGTVASKYKVCKRTVTRIWNHAKFQLEHELTVDVSSKMPTVVGRKRVQIDFNQVSEIPLRLRTNIRCIAKSLNVSKSTMHRRIKQGALRPHSNAIKPSLTDENKKARLIFCLSKIERSLSNSSLVFHNMFNVVHIDEKWFYMTKPTKRYYLVPGENEPFRTCKSKTFITKVMFLAAVARPIFDTSGNEVFSGKIGIYPLTTLEPAKRSSKNRVAGTLETKPITSVNKEAASQDGFDIQLCFQPPNSPDLNVLDLGYFRAIQSLQEQEALRTIDELVSAVQTSFDRMQSQELNNVFLTLQTCMKEVIKVKGGNNYRIPHIGKDRLQRQGGSETLGGQSRCGWLLGPSLDKIIKNAAWRKHSHIVSASKAALDILQSLSDDPNFSNKTPLFGVSSLPHAESLILPLTLAIDSSSPKVAEPALDCVYRLFSLRLIRCEIDGNNVGSLIYRLVDSICKCGGLGDEAVELAVLKCLLSAVRSTTVFIRADCLNQIIKTCYNVYLGGVNGTNQICAKAVLAQMMSLIFARVEADSQLATFNTVSVTDLLEFNDRNLNEGSSIQFVQNFINEVVFTSVVELNNNSGAASPLSPTEMQSNDDNVDEKGGDKVVGEDLSGYTKIRDDGVAVFKNLCKLSMKFSSQDKSDDHILLRGKMLSLELLRVIMDNAGPIWRTNERQVPKCDQTISLLVLVEEQRAVSHVNFSASLFDISELIIKIQICAEIRNRDIFSDAHSPGAGKRASAEFHTEDDSSQFIG